MLTDPALPYGLRDIKLYPMNSDGSYGTAVDLPISQTLSFSEAETFEELRGDDRLVAVHGKGPTVAFDLEAGGISLDAWHVLTGGTLTNTGSTPTQNKSFTKLVTDARGYFKIVGEAINDVSGDTHVTIYKCKLTDKLEGSFADGTFFVTKCSGQGLGDTAGNLYTIDWNETTVSLTAGVNEMQLIVSNATGGTFTVTFGAQTTSALAYNITTAALQTALQALSSVGANNLLVTGTAGAWNLEFVGTLAAANQALVTLGIGSLTGGSAAAATVRDGHA